MLETTNNLKLEPVDINISVSLETLIGVTIIVLLFLISKAKR